MHLVKRYMYGDSCDEALEREELAGTPGLVLKRSSRKGKTYLSKNMGIKSMADAVASDGVPLAERKRGSSSPAVGPLRGMDTLCLLRACLVFSLPFSLFSDGTESFPSFVFTLLQ